MRGGRRKVLFRRRRRRLPFEARRLPRIVRRLLAVEQRPAEIDERHQIGDGEDHRAAAGENVPDLKNVRIVVIAARHAEPAHDELRQERHVEAEEHGDGGELRPELVVELAGHLRPPIMNAGHEGRHRAADHDGVEMRDHEVSVRRRDVDRHRGEKQAGQAADGEQAEKAERIDHRRLEADVAAIERCRPVEHLDGRRHRDDERQKRKDEIGERRLTGDEHVMAPDHEADHADGQQREHHEGVAEHAPPREAGEHFGDHAHRRQDHDVDGGMAVEPEQVLEQQRIAAGGGIEDRQTEASAPPR